MNLTIICRPIAYKYGAKNANFGPLTRDAHTNLNFERILSSRSLVCQPVFRIRISFYADPNPGSQKCPYRTDPDPIADPDPRGINTKEEKFHQKLFN